MSDGLRVERLLEVTPEGLLLLEQYYESMDVVVRDDAGAMAQLLQDSGSGMWVGYWRNAPAGCVVLKAAVPDEHAGEVKRLYVRPAFRRKGVAEALMDAVEAFARERGLEWLYLDTNDAFQAAIVLYQRRGYSLCGRYNENPQATMFFCKPMGF